MAPEIAGLRASTWVAIILFGLHSLSINFNPFALFTLPVVIALLIVLVIVSKEEGATKQRERDIASSVSR